MTPLATALCEAAWLDRRRAAAWATLLAAACVLVGVALAVTTRLGTAPDSAGRPLGTDFSSFWIAGRLALHGDPAAAYRPEIHAAAQHAAFPAAAGYAQDEYAFFYPPPFLLVCAALATLPYGAAVIVWLAVTGAAYVRAVRALLPAPWPWMLAALANPAFLVNLGHGQNGALSMALLGAAATSLDRRPWLAGMSLGALCLKPQLAVLVFPTLAAARRWRALACACATATMLAAACLLAFGLRTWEGFLGTMPGARMALEAGWIGFAKMVSPFAAARALGGSLQTAWSLQIGALLLALSAVVMVARNRPGGNAEMAVLATAACLATPFLLDYDLMLLAVPLAVVAALGASSGFLPWEKLALAAAFTLPLAARPLAMHAGIPVAPAVIAVLLLIVTRRFASPTARSSRLQDAYAEIGRTAV